MPSIARSLLIRVPPIQVYEAFIALARWKQWNPHLREITPLYEGPMTVGSWARVAPKYAPTSLWRVTRMEPGRSFTWETALLPGLRLAFDHVAEADPAEPGTRATLRLRFDGSLSFLGVVAGQVYAGNLVRSLTALKGLLETSPQGDLRSS
jgi:hypothetical protein